jgi:hypothetical protein
MMIEHVDIFLYLVCLLDWSLVTLGRSIVKYTNYDRLV